MGCKYTKLSKCNFDNTPTFTLSGKKCNAKVLDVYDGDTLWLAIFVYNTLLKFKVRMKGYDSPELRPLKKLPNRAKEIEKAKEARDYLKSLVLNKIVIAEFFKFDKYGRPLCNLYSNKVCVNTLMIQNNYGYKYNGGKKYMLI